MQPNISNKLSLLKGQLSKFSSLIIAFSGGIDSSFLLRIAREAVRGKVIGITANSPIRPQEEIEHSKAIAKEIKTEHLIIETDEMKSKIFLQNSKLRCYICKKKLFLKLKEIAKKLKIERIACGENFDDLKKFRPGRKAAEEEGILSPLADIKLTKEEIRKSAKKIGLSNWNKPSFSCLATKIPYGDRLTLKKLYANRKKC